MFRFRTVLRHISTFTMKSTSNRVRFCTFNIRNTTDRYKERQPVLAKAIQDIGADIIGFQEVAWSQIPFLHSAFVPDKSVITCKSTCQDPILSRSKPCYRVDGDLLLAKTTTKGNANVELLQEDVLILSFERVVQRALLKITTKVGNVSNNSTTTTKSFLLWVLNTHLHDGLTKAAEIERLRQTKAMMEWLEEGESHRKAVSDVALDGIVVLGDFNANQEDTSYLYMKQHGFMSAFQVVKHAEPVTTFPTGLKASTMDTDPDIGCVDFVWIKGSALVPVEAGIAANTPAPNDSTIYPSDHFAVWADICLQTPHCKSENL